MDAHTTISHVCNNYDYWAPEQKSNDVYDQKGVPDIVMSTGSY